MRFTDAHNAATVCTPTRYSLMTGRMCFRTGHQSVFTGAGGPCLILPVLLGEQEGAPLRPYLIQQTMRHMLSIRVGDWKYIDHAGSGGNDYDSTDALWSMKPYALPNTDPGAAGQLYDLAADPGETANLFSRRPDVVARLKALLDESVRKGRSAPPRSAAAREVRLRNKPPQQNLWVNSGSGNRPRT